MNRLAILPLHFSLLLALSACNTSNVKNPDGKPVRPALTQEIDIDALLLEASTSQPIKSTLLKLRAADFSLEKGNARLADKILRSIVFPYISESSTRDYVFLSAKVAIANDNPLKAIQILQIEKFKNIVLTDQLKVRVGLLKAQA